MLEYSLNCPILRSLVILYNFFPNLYIILKIHLSIFIRSFGKINNLEIAKRQKLLPSLLSNGKIFRCLISWASQVDHLQVNKRQYCCYFDM